MMSVVCGYWCHLRIFSSTNILRLQTFRDPYVFNSVYISHFISWSFSGPIGFDYSVIIARFDYSNSVLRMKDEWYVNDPWKMKVGVPFNHSVYSGFSEWQNVFKRRASKKFCNYTDPQRLSARSVKYICLKHNLWLHTFSSPFRIVFTNISRCECQRPHLNTNYSLGKWSFGSINIR